MNKAVAKSLTLKLLAAHTEMQSAAMIENTVAPVEQPVTQPNKSVLADKTFTF
jgi:hypothetical protein